MSIRARCALTTSQSNSLFILTQISYVYLPSLYTHTELLDSSFLLLYSIAFSNFLSLSLTVSFFCCFMLSYRIISFISPSYFILAKSIAKQFTMKYKCWYYYLLMAQFSHICFSIHVLLVSPVHLVCSYTYNHQQFTN